VENIRSLISIWQTCQFSGQYLFIEIVGSPLGGLRTPRKAAAVPERSEW
jgi:hypothetical protein